MSYTYQYPRAALTADIVVYGFDGRQLHILLVERGYPPFKGFWALPGGFMRMDETIDACAKRELQEETGLNDVYLRQFGVFSAIRRDPRERVVTVAYLGLVNKSMYRLTAGDDAVKAEWFTLDDLPPLAFDHEDILERSRICLRDLIAIRPAVLRLLDEKFSIAELQRLVEAITGESYDRRNFQRRLIQSELLRAEGTSSEPGSTRPATLYKVQPPEPDNLEPMPSSQDNKTSIIQNRCLAYKRSRDNIDDFCEDSLCESSNKYSSLIEEETDSENPQINASKQIRVSKALRKGLDFFKF